MDSKADNKLIRSHKSEMAHSHLSVIHHSNEDKAMFNVVKRVGRNAVAHHFSEGRSVTVIDNGKVVRLYPDKRKEIIKG